MSINQTFMQLHSLYRRPLFYARSILCFMSKFVLSKMEIYMIFFKIKKQMHHDKDKFFFKGNILIKSINENALLAKL